MNYSYSAELYAGEVQRVLLEYVINSRVGSPTLDTGGYGIKYEA